MKAGRQARAAWRSKLCGRTGAGRRRIGEGSGWKRASSASAGSSRRKRLGRLRLTSAKLRRSRDQVRFLHPRGWSYYATLRRKLHWNAGLA